MVRALFNPMGTTALVTGASSGLGAGFARELARRGADLVLVARRQDRLERLAVELAEKFGTESTVIPLDLSKPDAAGELAADLAARKVTVGTLVNNAGFATYGHFADSDLGRELEEIDVNVRALSALTHLFLPDLLHTALRHPRGAALVNLASTAAFQPIPRMAVYAASKAYVLSFTEAISYETRQSGLKVLAVCPGATATEFARVAGTQDVFFSRSQTVEEVVATTFAALDTADTPASVISGRQNLALARMVRLGTRRTVLSAAGKMTTPAPGSAAAETGS